MGCELCEREVPTRIVEIDGEPMDICRQCREQAGA